MSEAMLPRANEEKEMKEEKEITRSPVEGESREEVAACYGARCSMQPNSDDLVIATRQKLECRLAICTVENNRAMRAGASHRIQAVEKFSLGRWRDAIRALYAVAYGTISGNVCRLLELCFYAKRRSEAYSVYGAFEAAAPEFYFADTIVYRAVRDVLSSFPNPRAVTLREVAKLCGLVAENGIYEPSDASGAYRRVGDEVDLEASLANGAALFRASALPDIMMYWEGLANRGVAVELPDELNWDSITAWAAAVIDAADEEEGTNSPIAGVQTEEDRYGDLRLYWDGTFTPGRNVRFSMFFTPEGVVDEEVAMTMEWDSATGRPSTFLNIQDMLALPGCFGFSPKEKSEAPA